MTVKCIRPDQFIGMDPAEGEKHSVFPNQRTVKKGQPLTWDK